MQSPKMRAEIDRRVADAMRKRGFAPKADPNAIAEQIRVLEGEISVKKVEREELSLRVVNNPRDNDADAELKRLNAVITELDSKLTLRRNAHAQSARLHSVDHRAAELNEICTWLRAAIDAARARVKVIKETYEPAREKMREALEEIARLNADCTHAAGRVAIACDDGMLVYNAHLALEPANGNSGAMAAAMLAELREAGIGLTGISIPQLYESFALISSPLSLVGAAALDANRLEARLSELLERKRKEFDQLDVGVMPLREKLRKEQQERDAADREQQKRLKGALTTKEE